MSDQPPSGLKSLDDPETKARVVWALLVISPFAGIGCFLFALVLGSRTQDASLIGGAALALCLGAAGTIQLLGAKARYVAMAIAVLGAFMRHH